MPEELMPERSDATDVETTTSARAAYTKQRAFYSATQATRRRVLEWLVEHFLLVMGLVAVVSMMLVLGFMLKDALPLLWDYVPNPTTGEESRLNLWRFLTGDTWRPGSTPERLEILVLLIGSGLVTLGASVIAIPIGFACAVYLAELAPRVVRETVKPVVEMLAAIPSVVIGFIGFTYLNLFMKSFLNQGLHLSGVQTGLMAFTASIMLAFMAMPTIISVSEDALSAVPRNYREGSLALGASPLATIRHAVWPAARSGLIAAAMLGVGRALGETMVVLMVSGGAKANPFAFMGEPGAALGKLSQLVHSGFGFFRPVATMTAELTTTPEAAPNTPHYHALFALGAILCIISFTITLVSDMALRRKKA